MVKVGVIGAGKMGISHLSLLGAHPDVQVVGVADTSKMTTDVLKKYSSFPCYSDYQKMLDEARPEAVFVAAPTRYHYQLVKALLLRNIHVFVEKPFCLDVKEGAELVLMAKRKGLVNQVGYHNKFIGTFQEVKEIVQGGFLGTIQHFVGESYGPVVVRKKQGTWRSKPEEGGGCLLDYASHVIDLLNYLVAPIKHIRGSVLKPLYSEQVEDSVYSLVETEDRTSGLLSVNWSDETYRKMSTTVTIVGTQGKIIADATELKVYFKTADCPASYTKGWNIKDITELTAPVDFYLRGEEYSAQVDYFINGVLGRQQHRINTFESAWLTDSVIYQIRNQQQQ